MKFRIEQLGILTLARRPLTAALLLAAVLVPVWSVNIPPLLDYHNHLARQFILRFLSESPQLQQFYAANWKASPYLAIDGVVQLLASLLPVAVSGKIFLTLTLLLLALSPLALNWANFGRITPIALLGLLFVHSTTVNLGFVSYLFSVGFALCLLALWIRFRERAASLRLAIFPLLATFLFFSHLLGFVTYGLSATAYELGRHVAQIRNRRPIAVLHISREQAIGLLSLTFQLLLPLTLFLMFGPETGSVSSNTYGGLLRKLELLTGAVPYLMPPYLWRLDSPLSVLLPAGLLGLLLIRKLTIAGPMLWPIGAMLAFFFLLPAELFSGWGADHRLLPAIGLMFVGSLRLREGQSRLAAALFTVIVFLVAIRIVAVTLEWRRADVEYGEYVQAFGAVGNGSRMFFAFGQPHEKQIGRRPYKHMPTLVLMKRHVFVPYLFAGDSGVGPLRYLPEVEPLRRIARGQGGNDGQMQYWPEIMANFDYVMLVDEHLFPESIRRQLTPVFKGKRVFVFTTPRRQVAGSSTDSVQLQ
jgi:hypothetical protein